MKFARAEGGDPIVFGIAIANKFWDIIF
jgi:hypothetical protein